MLSPAAEMISKERIEALIDIGWREGDSQRVSRWAVRSVPQMESRVCWGRLPVVWN